jgi:hypothetical protein
VIRLVTSVDRKPLCKKKSVLDGAPAFFAVNIKSTVKAPKTSIFYNGQLYRVRKPLGKVLSNWAAGVFTSGGKEYRGEADLLNDLGLSPKILGEVFHDAWIDELSRFLTAVSISKCFSDEGLLTYRECDSSRAFIKRIQEHMMNHDTGAEIYVHKPAAPVTIPNKNGVSLDDVEPGGFSSEFKIGSNIVYSSLTGWVMPVMIVNRLTNEYLLRQISVNDTKATEDNVRGYLEQYKQTYPDWLFLT